MKTPLLPCFAVILGVALTASGQMPVSPMHPHSLSLQVTPLGTGSGGEHAIEISVHNFGKVSDAAQVEWYFVAEPTRPEPGKPVAARRFVFDKGSQSVSLAANGAAKIPVTPREMTAGPTRQAGLHTGKSHGTHGGGDKETGNVPSGWIVRVVAGGRVLETKGSQQELEDVGKDNAKLAAMAAKN